MAIVSVFILGWLLTLCSVSLSLFMVYSDTTVRRNQELKYRTKRKLGTYNMNFYNFEDAHFWPSRSWVRRGCFQMASVMVVCSMTVIGITQRVRDLDKDLRGQPVTGVYVAWAIVLCVSMSVLSWLDVWHTARTSCVCSTLSPFWKNPPIIRTVLLCLSVFPVYPATFLQKKHGFGTYRNPLGQKVTWMLAVMLMINNLMYILKLSLSNSRVKSLGWYHFSLWMLSLSIIHGISAMLINHQKHALELSFLLSVTNLNSMSRKQYATDMASVFCRLVYSAFSMIFYLSLMLFSLLVWILHSDLHPSLVLTYFCIAFPLLLCGKTYTFYKKDYRVRSVPELPYHNLLSQAVYDRFLDYYWEQRESEHEHQMQMSTQVVS